MPVARVIRAFAAALCLGALFCISPAARAVETCPAAVEGDVDCSGDIAIADLLTMTAFVLRGENHICPVPLVADLNLDGVVNAADVIRMVDYLFRDGPAPSGICDAHFGDSALAIVAEEMALAYSGVLVAPTELKWRLYADLEAIRADDPGLSTLRFYPPWATSYLYLRVSKSTGHRMAVGAYKLWDSLNAACELDREHISSDFQWVQLWFAGLKNPRVLARLYGDLPGVEVATFPYVIGMTGPEVYALVSRQRMVYVARAFLLGSPDGIPHSRYWYYTSSSTGVVRMGYWDGIPPEPDWFPVAAAAFEAYRGL